MVTNSFLRKKPVPLPSGIDIDRYGETDLDADLTALLRHFFALEKRYHACPNSLIDPSHEIRSYLVDQLNATAAQIHRVYKHGLDMITLAYPNGFDDVYHAGFLDRLKWMAAIPYTFDNAKFLTAIRLEADILNLFSKE